MEKVCYEYIVNMHKLCAHFYVIFGMICYNNFLVRYVIPF